MSEIEQLRIDLKVLERHACDHIDIREAEKTVRLKIAQLEAEADPWREAKNRIDAILLTHNDSTWERNVANFVLHLESENTRLTSRIAELEARELPPLDAKRVFKTAQTIGMMTGPAINGWWNAEPYPLQEPK